MRILHVIPTLQSGGAEKMLIEILEKMKEQGHICEIVVLTQKGNFLGDELKKLDIPVYYGPTEKVYTFKNITFLKNMVKQNEYDIIHTHLFSSQLFVPIALKMTYLKIPIVTTEHNTHNRRRENKIFYFLDHWMYKQYDEIIAITPETKVNLNNYLPFTKNKTSVILNGIKLDKYINAKPIEKNKLLPDIKDDEKLVIMVAAMRDQKDHETLIRASKFLPKYYRILFVGDGDRLIEVKEYAEKNGTEKISFLGNRLDVPAILKACDVFVLSSKWEGFGLVVVEAAAAGLPVVASDVEGLSNIVKSIEGHTFEPFNEEELAEKILTATQENKKEVKEKMEIYSIQNTVKKYLELYNKVKDKW